MAHTCNPGTEMPKQEQEELQTTEESQATQLRIQRKERTIGDIQILRNCGKEGHMKREVETRAILLLQEVKNFRQSSLGSYESQTWSPEDPDGPDIDRGLCTFDLKSIREHTRQELSVPFLSPSATAATNVTPHPLGCYAPHPFR